MSTPTLFFTATAGEALTMDLPAGLHGQPTVKSKNITPDIIGDLDFLLTGEREREPVCLREEENVFVFRLDDELTASLAELNDEQLPEIADEWGIFDLPGTISFLAELRTLARRAVALDEEMFFYF
jgi:hypothetical protein